MKKILVSFIAVIVISFIIFLGVSTLHLHSATHKGDTQLKSGYWICDCTKDYVDCKCIIVE